jgi:branched-chain amino acid transport system ATP-binding protein
MGPPAGLALDGIGVRFGGLVALDDVALHVPPGRVVGLIGPNGAGKTTVFNVICGFVRPATGSITMDGRPLRARPHRLAALGIARTLQGIGLFDGLTVLENVLTGARRPARAGFAAALFGLPRADRAERQLRAEALDLLAELGIADHADAAPGTLPHAVRKRVALARALAARPRLLLLDEPAGGLGADEIEELAGLIRRLPGRAGGADEAGGGCAVLLVEHHMDLVMSVCDEIAVLDFGRLIATGPPEKIRDDPAVADAYLGTAADDAPDPADDLAAGSVDAASRADAAGAAS